jgi:ATP-binding cassette subfamily B protein
MAASFIGRAQRSGRSPARSSTYSQLRLVLAGRRARVASLAISSILCGVTESGILAILAQSATALVNHQSRVRSDLGPVRVDESLGVLLAAGLLLILIRLALQIVVSAVPARIIADMQERLRIELFAAFTRASWSEQSRDREGHLQELLTNQVQQAILTAIQGATLVMAALAFLVLVVSALVLNAVTALFVLVAAIAIFALLRPLTNLSNRQGQALSRQFLTYANGVSETVRLAEETHVFGADAAAEARSRELVAPMTVSYFKGNFIARFVPGTYQILIYLLVIGSLGALHAVGSSHVASLSAVVLLLVRAGMYGQQAQAAYTGMRQVVPHLERLQEAEARYLSSTPVPGTRPLREVRSIAFRDVSFAYQPRRSVLSRITFEVMGGDAIGVVGPSGAGKSTLVQLLLCLRSPTSGGYLVNDLPAEEFRPSDWHARFAYVPQEPRLLHASVSDNIRFFREIDHEDVERAARLAGIHDDVTRWSAGYDTMIGPRADAVSGGQQQRICLARALAAEPEVLILDEPTSALDPHSEALIRSSLLGLKDKLTLFIVAHRMSTLDICERVMVIVDGRLEAFDRSDRLSLSSSYYASVAGTRAQTPLATTGPVGQREPLT